MRIYYGIVHPERKVFTADSGPELENVQEIESVDWGPDAATTEVERLATIMIPVYCLSRQSVLAKAYADSVLRQIRSDRPWQINEVSIRQWVDQFRWVETVQ